MFIESCPFSIIRVDNSVLLFVRTLYSTCTAVCVSVAQVKPLNECKTVFSGYLVTKTGWLDRVPAWLRLS